MVRFWERMITKPFGEAPSDINYNIGHVDSIRAFSQEGGADTNTIKSLVVSGSSTCERGNVRRLHIWMSMLLQVLRQLGMQQMLVLLNHFASSFKKPIAPKAVNLKEMKCNETVSGENVAIPLAAVEEVSNRFNNTLYGYFIGKRLAFPISRQNLVWNSLCLLMASFSFNLLHVRVWNGYWIMVKLHHVPIVAFSETGLSLITSQLGHPIMLDAYTSTMCQKSWGRNTYARALIEVSMLNHLKESLVVAIPFPIGSGHSLETIEVEDDGFTQVSRKNSKGKQEGRSKHVAGVRLNKPKPNLYYRVVQKFPNAFDGASSSQQNASKKGTKHPTGRSSSTNEGINFVSIYNSFDALTEQDKILDVDDPPPIKSAITSHNEALEDDDEEVEEVFAEHDPCTSNKYKAGNSKGASTPFQEIILGWNPDVVNVVVILFNAQVMHTCVYFKADKKRSWCLLRDFNVSLSANEKSSGSPYIDIGMRDFQECVEAIEVSDVNSLGLRFTWNQKPKDHSPNVLRIPIEAITKPHPFKFCNIVVHNTRFKDIVTQGWQNCVSGFWMFKVVKRLKVLKKPLCKLLYDHGNLHDNVKRLRIELDAVQIALDSDPSNIELREEEAAYL
ncbi:hypothetical protein Tco_0835726 [Tanacetum coccineum]